MHLVRFRTFFYQLQLKLEKKVAAMASSAEQFYQEFQKVHALNKVNLEIVERLGKFFKSSKSAQVPGKLQVSAIQQVFFRHHRNDEWRLSFIQRQVTFKIQPAKDFLESVNLFNDKLSENIYPDLEPILEKYKMLSPQYGLEYVTKWKTALENIQVHYGQLEQKINDLLADTLSVYKLLGITPPPSCFEAVDVFFKAKNYTSLTSADFYSYSSYHSKPSDSSVSLSFTVNIPEHMKLLEHLRICLDELFKRPSTSNPEPKCDKDSSDDSD